MIVKQLIEIQKQRGLTNSQMAESLGIHKVSWYRNKRTKVIDAATLLRAFEVYPELREEFLSSFPNPAKRAHKRFLGGLLPRLMNYITGR